jgi:hypothetical protein
MTTIIAPAYGEPDHAAAFFDSIGHWQTSNTSPARSLRWSIERLPSRQPRGATADGEATAVKRGGFSAPTQAGSIPSRLLLFEKPTHDQGCDHAAAHSIGAA